MKPKDFTIVMLTIFLVYSCSMFEKQKPSASCVSGKVIFTKADEPNSIYLLDLETGVQKVLISDTNSKGTSRWSPDGSSIAFVGYTGDNSEIYTISSDGSNLIQITDTPNIELAPSWSPDGKYMLATSMIDKHSQIIKIKSDGSKTHQITAGNFDFGQPSWSPNGKEIVYSSNEEGQTKIYIMSSDGNNQHPLNEKSFGYSPKWSPDGKYISYSSNYFSARRDMTRIVLYDIQNQDFSLLLPEDMGESQEKGHAISNPVWSKNGKCIMFVWSEDSSYLYAIDFASREMIKLNNLGIINSMDWISE